VALRRESKVQDCEELLDIVDDEARRRDAMAYAISIGVPEEAARETYGFPKKADE